jgi:hypothetical protein
MTKSQAEQMKQRAIARYPEVEDHSRWTIMCDMVFGEYELVLFDPSFMDAKPVTEEHLS